LKLIGRKYLRWGIPCLAAAVLLAACGSGSPLSASTHPFNTRAPVPVETPPTRAPAISTTAGLTWSHPAQPFRGLTSVAGSPPSDLVVDLVCPTASFCAVSNSDDGFGSPNSGDGAVSVYSDGSWSAPTMPFSSRDSIDQLVCPTASFCVVSSNSSIGPSGKVSIYSDGHWSAPTMPFGSRDGIELLECPSATFCVVSSTRGNGFGGKVSIYSDGHWSAPTMPFGSRDRIDSLVCSTTSFCAVSISNQFSYVGKSVSMSEG